MTGFIYKTYSFVDKDPLIDYVRTIVQDSGQTLKHISEESGVSTATIANWLYGETKQPRASSVNAVLRALGYKLEISLISMQPIVKPTPYGPASKKSATIHKMPRRA